MTNTHMDQWGFQGIIIMWEILVMFFLGSSCEIWQISMEFLCFGDHWLLWGIITFLREPLRDLGKSQWSSFTGGVYMGKSQWSSFTWGRFTRESYSCLKGASDEYSHGPMRSTVWSINWGNNLWGTMD